MKRQLIIDLSNNNRVMNLNGLRALGIVAVWLKVTEGTHFFDATYRLLREKAERAGLHVGGYHFARIERQDPTSEALYFLQHLGKVRRGDLRPMIDMEVYPVKGGNIDLAQWAHDFSHRVHVGCGYPPVFYSYSSYIASLHLPKPIGDGLVLASYGRNDGHEYPIEVPRPWRHALAHQFSSQCRVPGVQGFVDLSSTENARALIAGPYFGRV